MELMYEISEDGNLTNIRFEGLSGSEHVSSVKEALGVMQIKNPAVSFTQDCKAGMYDAISDEEYSRLLKAVERVSLLWQYDGTKAKSDQYTMNPLMLLANAIEMISRQSVELQKPKD